MGQVQKSSAFSRRVVNLFAGMAYGSPDLPRVLFDGGYRCHAIEPTFSVSSNKQVNPELILCSDLDEHTLILEAKSGANLKSDQLERYAQINADALQKRAFTSLQSANKHNLVIVGQEFLQERLKIGSALVPSLDRVLLVVQDGSVAPPGEGSTEVIDDSSESQQQIPGQPDLVKESALPEVASVADSNDVPVSTSGDAPLAGLLHVENEFATPRLNSAFKPFLEVDWEIVPHNFLPVDHESEEWEYAQYLIPEIIAAILNGETMVRLDHLAETFIRHWQFIANDYRTTLLNRMRMLVKLASQKRFSMYVSTGEKGSNKNEVKLIIPDNLAESYAVVRSQLQRRFRELMQDLNSPQIAMIYEDE